MIVGVLVLPEVIADIWPHQRLVLADRVVRVAHPLDAMGYAKLRQFANSRRAERTVATMCACTSDTLRV